MPGGGRITVSSSLLDGVGEGKNQVQIVVADTGKGIPKEDINKIFSPFYTTKEDGTGLGLATVYRVVESLGGRISVMSEVGVGSSFIITLPVEEAASA